MFISELHTEGYKRLKDVTLPLGPLTVLIGPNASGKTSVLEAFQLLTSSAQGELGRGLVRHGGIEAVLARGTASHTVSLSGRFPFGDGGHLAYRLDVQRQRNTYCITFEHLDLAADRPPSGVTASDCLLEVANDHRRYFDPETGVATDVTATAEASETALAQVPQDHRLAHAFSQKLSACAFYGPPDMQDDPPIRRPQKLNPVRWPAPNGTDLVATLQHRRAREPAMFDFIVDAMRSAYSGFEGLDFELVGGGYAVLQWRERGQVYYGNELSEGTLRFLWLAALLASSEPPPLLVIDEPEVSLHPALLVIVRDLLEEGANGGQVVVATQSPELVSWLKPEQIVVLDLDEEGWTTATPGTELDLAGWLERYTLGELWTKGVLGGRP